MKNSVSVTIRTYENKIRVENELTLTYETPGAADC